METNQDQEHLRLLSIFHYIVGGLMALFSLFPLLHIAMGLFLLLSPSLMDGSQTEQVPLNLFAWFFVGAGAFMVLLGEAFAVCIIASGRFISGRRRHLFSFIVGCVEILFVPFGTILGIFTIIVLSRDSVKQLYSRSSGPE